MLLGYDEIKSPNTMNILFSTYIYTCKGRSDINMIESEPWPREPLKGQGQYDGHYGQSGIAA